MNDVELRQWCLEQVVGIAGIMAPREIVGLAEEFYQYVKNGPLTKEAVKQAA